MTKLNIVTLQDDTIRSIAQVDDTYNGFVFPELSDAQYVISPAAGDTSSQPVAFDRSGDDLQLTIGGETPTTLTFSHYFTSGSQVVGLGDDGQYHQFNSVTALQNGEAPAADAAVLAAEPAQVGNVLSSEVAAPTLVATHDVNATAVPVAVAQEPAATATATDVTATATDAPVTDAPPTTPDAPAASSDGPSPLTIDQVYDDHGNIQGVVPNGGYTDDAEPVLSGVLEGGSGLVLNIFCNAQSVGSALVGEDGSWTVTPTESLEPYILNDQLSFTAVVKDPIGDQTYLSLPYTVNFAPEVVPVASIDYLYDDVGRTQGHVANGGVTDDATPTLFGTATAGALVTIFDGGKTIGSALADTDGNWAYAPISPMTEGTHNFTVQPVYDAVTGDVSAPYAVTIDVTAPLPLNDVTAMDDVGPVQGPISIGGYTDDNQPTFTGKADPGKIVTIYENGVAIGSAAADASGTWSVTPATPLADGQHAFVDTVTDPAGNISDPGFAGLFTVDTAAPPAPALDNLVVTDDVGPVQGPVAPGGITDDNQPTFSGSNEEPGSVVTVLDGGQPVASAVVAPDGSWNVTPDTPMADGAHEITLTATDPAGNVSPASDPFDFTIDTSAPSQITIDTVVDDVEPVVGDVAQNGSTNDAQPTINGTTVPNGSVNVYDNGTLIGSAVADSNGKWSLTPSTDLADGEHSVTATAVSATGAESQPTDPFAFTVDTVAPDAPAIDSPDNLTVTDDVGPIQGPVENGGTTDDNQPTFSGTGQQPGDVITVHDNGVPFASAVVDPDGNWNVTPALPMADGPHAITLTDTDPAGNVSAPSDPFNFDIDTVAPAAPCLDNLTVTDDVGPVQGPIAQGDTTDDNQPTFAGTHEAPGTVVTVLDGDQPIASAVVDPDGNWSVTPDTPMADGPHEVTFTATDPAGVTSAPSEPFDFTIDTSAPSTITIDSVVDDVDPIVGDITPNGATNDAQPTVNGTTDPDGKVNVYDNGTLIGSAVADSDGKWSFTPSTDLTDGEHSVTATAVNASGTESQPTDPFAFTVDTVAPPAPSLDDLTVTDDVGPVQGPIAAGDTTDDNTPTFSGTNEEPGAVVTVLDDGKPVASGVVDQDGNWTATPDTPLADGPHEATFTATDPAGNTSAPSDPFDFTVDTAGTPPPVAPSLDDLTVTDDVGPIQGPIAPDGTTDDNQPTFSGTNEAPGNVVTVLDDGKPIASAVVDPDGNWSVTPDTPMADGPHEITLTATDPTTGSTSDPSAPFDFTVDTAAPPVPSLDDLTVTDDVGPVQGPIAAGDTTDDNQPTFSGTNEEPGAVVTVLDDGKPVASGVVDQDGNWTATPDTPLADGPHEATFTATDPAGNTSAPSDPFDFTVDTNVAPPVPPTPTLDTVSDDVGPKQGPIAAGDTTDDSTPTFAGSGQPPGDTITVLDGDKPIGTAVVDPDGNWSVTPETPLADGPHDITVTDTDPNGNTSAPSDPFDFNVDTSDVVVSIDNVVDDIAPVVGDVPNDGFTNDSQPTINGSATPNSQVNVYDNGTQIGSTTSDADGKWSFTPTDALTDGAHSVTATVVTPATGESDPTSPFDFTVDTVAPNNTDLVVSDDDGNTVPPGGTTDDTTPTLSGDDAEPGSTVIISDDGQPIGSTVVDPDGNWNYTPDTPWDQGPHDITTEVVDPAGNSSGPSDPTTINVGPQAPDLVSGHDDFDSDPDHVFTTVGDSVTLDSGLTITYDVVGVDGSANNTATEITSKGIKLFTPEFGEKALVLLADSETKYEFGGQTNQVSFDVAGANYDGSSVNYYDADGNLLHTTTIAPQTGEGQVDTISWAAPEGQTIAYMTIDVGPESTGDTGIRVDNFAWGTDAAPDNANVAPSVQDTQDAATPLMATMSADHTAATTASDAPATTVNFEQLQQQGHEAQGVVDMHEVGKGTLSLSLDDVVSHSEQNLLADDGKSQLAIQGEDGGHVELTGVSESSLSQQGSVTTGGVTYDVYSVGSQNTELLVQHGLELHTSTNPS